MKTIAEVYRLIMIEAQDIRYSNTDDEGLNSFANGLYRAAALLEETAEINPPIENKKQPRQRSPLPA